MPGSEQVDISRIIVKDPSKPRSSDIPSTYFSSDARTVLNDPSVQLVVSLLGDGDFEGECISKALSHEKFVVTANKEVIAKHGPELFKTAKENGVGLLFEASVGGGIPIIDTFRERHTPNTFHSILGILNGTTNFILTKMAETGMDFSIALKQAQDLGYAEPDSTNDIQGYDARYKLAILASLVFKQGWVDYKQIYTEGISNISWQDLAYAKNLGYVVKLIASATNTNRGIEAWVAPAFVYNKHSLASVNGATNAIYYDGDPIGAGMIYGKGAGKPTTSSVWSDIVSACHHIRDHTLPTEIYSCKEAKIAPFESRLTKDYLRLTVRDEIGILRDVCRVLGEHNVSINETIQFDGVKWAGENKGKPASYAEFIIDTDPSEEGNITRALKDLEKLDAVDDIGARIRIIRDEESLMTKEQALKVFKAKYFNNGN